MGRFLVFAGLLGCGGGRGGGIVDAADDAVDDTVVLSLEKPALLHCPDGNICPLMGGPRCMDGMSCSQLTFQVTSDPAGILCGTDDDALACTATFPLGTTVTLSENHLDFSGFCPIHACIITSESATHHCEEPFVIDADYAVTFMCIAP